ncbi:MAG: hypothetical protein A2Y75_01535 [Candidatus Solincola sediminis]|uniref:Uncharacterized protein n=1 Tax=Candidatus Solincola sediminis TaxID=1797199 RepID=A0A1F2WNK2_9ACTN|nr:MAG: hypothetical protein A2Y75_01535 [Candidatus Solincola sediminis]
MSSSQNYQFSAKSVTDTFSEARRAAGIHSFSSDARDVHSRAVVAQGRMSSLISRLRSNPDNGSRLDDARLFLRQIAASAERAAVEISGIEDLQMHFCEISAAIGEAINVFSPRKKP